MSTGQETPSPEQITTRLAEIRERASKAMPGPWFWHGNRKMDTVSLSNPYDGSTMIFDVDVREVEYVYDHIEIESYSLEEARSRYLLDPALMPEKPYEEMDAEDLKELCVRRGIDHVEHGEGSEDWTAHDYVDALLDWDADHGYDGVDWTEERTRQGELRAFLLPERLYPDDHYASVRKGGQNWLSRNVTIRPDLRLNVGGLMHSYRGLARFAVLDGRTEAEHEAAGGMIDGERRDLYREDIVGIDTPEAEFIAHSREDVEFLLGQVERLQAELAAARS